MKHLWTHNTKREGLYKFLLLLCVMIGYFAYLWMKYGFATGGFVAALTWSFFVLCTPIADAGFLLDFPIRLITGLRMLTMEVIVWLIAISINATALFFTPEIYQTTFLTSLFQKILTTPWPYWSIIALCCAGTFLSVKFGDELLDVIHHKERAFHHKHLFKWQLIGMIALILIIIWGYAHLIDTLGVEIPAL